MPQREALDLSAIAAARVALWQGRILVIRADCGFGQDQPAGLCDTSCSVVAEHPKKLEAFIIGSKTDAQATARILCNLTDQEARGENLAVAGCDNSVTGADEVGIFEKVDRRACRIVTDHKRPLARRLNDCGNPAGGIGQKDHAACVRANP